MTSCNKKPIFHSLLHGCNKPEKVLPYSHHSLNPHASFIHRQNESIPIIPIADIWRIWLSKSASVYRLTTGHPRFSLEQWYGVVRTDRSRDLSSLSCVFVAWIRPLIFIRLREGILYTVYGNLQDAFESLRFGMPRWYCKDISQSKRNWHTSFRLISHTNEIIIDFSEIKVVLFRFIENIASNTKENSGWVVLILCWYPNGFEGIEFSLPTDTKFSIESIVLSAMAINLRQRHIDFLHIFDYTHCV